MRQFANRKEFNEAFGIRSNDEYGKIPVKEYMLEYDMIREEIDEYLEACAEHNEVEILDALGDIGYLWFGMLKKHGVTQEMIEDVMNEIHASNMSKLGSDGKPILREDGKIMKSERYFKPDLTQFL